MSIIELKPIDSRKSFYNKCKVERNGFTDTLYSYDTKVAQYNYAENVLILSKNENHFTQTTVRHIKSFLNFVGIEPMTRKEMIEYYK